MDFFISLLSTSPEIYTHFKSQPLNLPFQVLHTFYLISFMLPGVNHKTFLNNINSIDFLSPRKTLRS